MKSQTPKVHTPKLAREDAAALAGLGFGSLAFGVFPAAIAQSKIENPKSKIS
jgi:hypothetical protein